MTHHGNTGIDNRRSSSHSCRRSAFQLHCINLALFHESHCGANGLMLGALIGPKGHVTQPEEFTGTASNCPAVAQQFVDCDWEGSVVAVDHHCSRVADQANVCTSSLDMNSRRVVIGCDHNDWLPGLIHPPDASQVCGARASRLRAGIHSLLRSEG